MKVILIMAVTADGMIARNSMELIDWTGKGDKKYFVHLTREAGVIIMGSKTFDTIGKVLPERKNIVMTRDKTTRDKKRTSRNKDLIFTSQTPEEILNDLNTQGFESVALIGGSVVNTLFMKKNLIDEVHVTIVPRLFGKGLSLFNQSLDKRLELMDMEKIDQNYVLLKYRVKN
ncbi:MAG: dihydrofolate reductase [Desulfobacula sp.]|jgi:dihydrofolate reductase|nr:dihydrofolate reductase [Desulfobacula sp.]MBT7261294.1 dihydrofolate reductase [Desulfobacula sp.]